MNPEERQRLQSRALLELTRAVAPTSRQYWEVEINDQHQVTWTARFFHAIIREIQGGFEVHKVSGGVACRQKQHWPLVPSLEYALALGEFA